MIKNIFLKKINYLVIPLITIIVSFSGGLITDRGMDWYKTISKPSFTPEGSFIGMVWTILFILATISVLIFWNIHKPHGKLGRNLRFWLITGVFIVNALLNILWSYLFFGLGLIYMAFLEAVILALTVVLLSILLWPISKLSSMLLIPYTLWVSFASYLTWNVWLLNKPDAIM